MRTSGYPKGFVMVPNEFFGTADSPGPAARLPQGAVGVYVLIIQRYHHVTGKGSYESHASMAKRLGISEPTLRKHLRALKKEGLIRLIRYGGRRYRQYVYEPELPIKNNEVEDNDEATTKDSCLTLGKNVSPNTNNSFVDESEEAMSQQEDMSKFTDPIRAPNRDRQSLSIDTQVRALIKDPDSHDLSTLTQAVWQLWTYLWERHYGREYYAAKDPDNQTTVPRDKKNLRTLIKAVGYPEVVRRMRRCFEVCDKLYPCVQKGKRVKPIMLNDFVNRRFFDQWIPLPEENAARGTTRAERLQRMREKRQEATAASQGEDGRDDVGTTRSLTNRQTRTDVREMGGVVRDEE